MLLSDIFLVRDQILSLLGPDTTEGIQIELEFVRDSTGGTVCPKSSDPYHIVVTLQNGSLLLGHKVHILTSIYIIYMHAGAPIIFRLLQNYVFL